MQDRQPVPLRVRLGEREKVITEAVVIGRESAPPFDCSDPRVSRRHLQLRPESDGWIAEDLRTRNGTYQAGERIGRVRVGAGVVLLLGDASKGIPIELVPVPSGSRIAEATPTLTLARSRVEAIHHAAIDLGPMTISSAISGDVTIGRATDNTVVLADLTVSRHHARLVQAPGRTPELIDLRSHNGTYINGVRIERAPVTDTDVIGIANHSLRLRGNRLEDYARADDVSFEAVNLSVHIGPSQLLDEVSFSVPRHTFLAAVGPSGAGKSTLLSALAGFRPADQGTVHCGGRDLYASYDEFRQRIGYVPQDDILHPQLTVRRALRYGAELRFPSDVSRADRNGRVDEVISELRLSSRARQRIDRLSGGQRKRVSIALELLTRPRLLFLDEPTSGLDPGMEQDLMELLQRLAADGRTVIVVTHSVQSLNLCDRVLFLAPGGKTAYYGPPRDALAYFGRSDFAQVFRDLERGQRDFKEEFRKSPVYDQFVRPALVHSEFSQERRAAVPAQAPPPRQNRWRQFLTLSHRYLAVIASDPANTAILLLQAPILAAIILLAVSPGGFDAANSSALNAGLQAILFLVVSATYLGAGNSIREIVKELPVYTRERMVGISIPAYLASKVIILSVVTAAQAGVLVWLGTLRQGGTGGGALLPNLRLELWLALVATGLAAMALGLLVSALTSRGDKALTLLPLILVPQLVLTLPQLRIDDKPILGPISYVASAQWGHAAAASTIHLNQLIYRRASSFDPSLPAGVNPDRPSAALVDRVAQTTDLALTTRWRHDPRTWITDVGALVGLFLVELVLAGYALKRRDPALLSASARRRR
ncbi:MAG TPA: ATP-binding cassette domain-containing protein [Candidatus Dormibacteraeota bacterium]|nr:ATP-binding cassette domain-containing protein [Candidatus Dormibacteraeota bacterium]